MYGMEERKPLELSRARTRGYLPHVEREGGVYFVTFRLTGTLPQWVLEQWEFERCDIENIARMQNRELTKHEHRRLAALYTERVESYLDKGIGDCWLRDARIARLVVGALNYFHKHRYDLHCWCVMPNHVHVVFTPLFQPYGARSVRLHSILHSWKSYTAGEANQILARTGTFWQREYYDHLIRDEEEFDYYIKYTLENPVIAGLCRRWQDWPWSGLLVG